MSLSLSYLFVIRLHQYTCCDQCSLKWHRLLCNIVKISIVFVNHFLQRFITHQSAKPLISVECHSINKNKWITNKYLWHSLSSDRDPSRPSVQSGGQQKRSARDAGVDDHDDATVKRRDLPSFISLEHYNVDDLLLPPAVAKETTTNKGLLLNASWAGASTLWHLI